MEGGTESQRAAMLADAIDRICDSPGFRRSTRLRRFLRFLASTQAGERTGPKEYEIARHVYDKPEDFNPQIDPIVRVEAGRLRLRLAEYYGEAGRDDPVVLELPKGSYVLRCRLHGGERVSAEEISTTRRHYLRGRYLWSRRTAESIEQAIVCFRKAIDEDCLDSAAWSGLADCYLVMSSFEFVRPDVVLPRAIAAARKALELDPKSAEACSSLAAATVFYGGDAEVADRAFEQAIALDPEYASAWQFYGITLFGRGLYDRAFQALQTAQSLDPLSPMFTLQLATLHYVRREFREAASLCDDLMRLEPEFWPARCYSGMASEQQGRTAEAIRHLEMAVKMSGRSHFPLAALAHVYAGAGRREEAVFIADELEQRRATRHCSAAAIAIAHVGLENYPAALHWLQVARCERSPYIAMFLHGDPRLDVLRADPKFASLQEPIPVPDQS
jgi:tetratricopeptide (TPR) repeat protein